MPAIAPAPSLVEDPGSLVTRFGAVVGLAVAAAAASSVPAAVRVARSLPGIEGAAQHAWVALAAATLVPMLAAVMVLRAAREGLRAFGGPGARLRIYGVLLWLAWLVILLALFGSALRRTTHQHALAGVTFACGAVVLALGVGVACARVVSILRAARGEVRRTAGAALAVGTAGAVSWIGLAFLQAVASDPASVAASGMVLDLLAFLLAAFLASRRSVAAFAVRRTLALVGPPIAVALAALGLASLQDGALVAAMRERAPAYAPALDVVAPP
jgi:hypothetical protein